MWFSLPMEGKKISEDGQTFSGRTQETTPAGTVISEWNLHAVREQ